MGAGAEGAAPDVRANVDARGRAALAVPAPGRYRVELTLWERHGSVTSGSPLPAPEEVVVDVYELEGEQDFEVALAAEVAEAIRAAVDP